MSTSNAAILQTFVSKTFLRYSSSHLYLSSYMCMQNMAHVSLLMPSMTFYHKRQTLSWLLYLSNENPDYWKLFFEEEKEQEQDNFFLTKAM